MFKIIKSYLDKNLFYVSVIVSGLTSGLIGVFYTLYKDKLFELTTDNFLEGTGVLGAYITSSTGRPSETNYFLIGLVFSILFFFIISFIISKFLKKKYTLIFNLLSLLNVVLLIGLVLNCLFINLSLTIVYIFIGLFIFAYLFLFYKVFKEIFNLLNKEIAILFSMLLIPFIIILIVLKLFV